MPSPSIDRTRWALGRRDVVSDSAIGIDPHVVGGGRRGGRSFASAEMRRRRYGTAMAILQVLRHAQAQSFAARDHDRALTADGTASARAVGRVLAVTGVPDRVLVSTARRTRQTVDEAMLAGDWHADVVPIDVLYGGDPTDVLDVLAAEAGDRASVLLVGHEPWCSGLVGMLTGAQVRMSAASLATLQVGPGWDALDPGWCSLTSFIPAWLAGRLEPAARR